MKPFKKFVSLLLLATLFFAAACTGGGGSPASSGGDDVQPESTEARSPYYVADIELSLWCSMDGKGFDNISSFADIWCYQEMERLTGVKIKWLHPPVGQEEEQFNLIVGSGDYPDLMYFGINENYPGGALKAVRDNVIIDLTAYMTPEKSPHISALYDRFPLYKKSAMTDEGVFYMYARVDGYTLIPEYDYFCIYNGFQYRIDWAEELGIAPPDTMDEWHDLLVAFRDNSPNGEGNTVLPLVAQRNLNNWMAPFGILNEFFMDNGKISYMTLSPKYRTYVETMSNWFSEGLIDRDYLATDGTMFKNKIVSNQGGVIIGGIGGNFGGITQAFMDEYGDKVVWGATSWPVSTDGSGNRYHFNTAPSTYEMGFGLVIFSKNKYKDESAKWCDMNFAPDIIEMMNFGEKGVSYDKDANGNIFIVPEFKEKMMAASDANTVICEIAQAAMNDWGTMIHPEFYVIQWVIPGQFEAAVAWNKNRCDDLLIPLITLTAEEGTRNAEIMSQVRTYEEEVRNKIIMGEMGIESLDGMIANIDKMGIDESVAFYNAALTRFNNR